MWSRTLAEIGYSDGVSLTRGDGQLTLFWAIPEAARSAHGALTLALATFTPEAAPGAAAILIDNAPVAALDLVAGTATHTLNVAISARALADGIVRLDIVPAATGACGERPRITALPDSVLTLDVTPPPSLDAHLALLPHRVALALPSAPLGAATYRNVAVIAAALARAGHRVVFAASGTGADLRLTANGAALETGADGVLVVPATREMAARIARPVAGPLPVEHIPEPAIALTALNVLPAARIAAPRASWTFALPLDALPPGLWPGTLIADVTAPADGTGARHTLTLAINDQLVASTLLPIGGATRRVSLPIPRGALNATNALRVTLTRVGLDTLCAQDPLPVSLGPDALVTLSAEAAPPRQFFELAHGPAASTALWITPGAMSDPATSLPFVLALTTRTVRDLGALALHLTSEGFNPGTAPFLYLGADPPPGLDVMTLPAHAPDATFAALVAVDDTPGVWLHPGTDARGDLPALERGRFAALNAAGDLIWSNGDLTTRRLVLSAEGEGLARFVKHYWPWTAALLWLAATGATLIAVVRRRKDP